MADADRSSDPSSVPASAGILVLSVAGRRAGLASRHSEGFLFHACDHLFNDIYGRLFASIGDMRIAARCLASLERLSPRALRPWPG